MTKLDYSKLSYREYQVSGLMQSLMHEIEPILERLPKHVGAGITSEVARETAVDLLGKSDSITALLNAIQDLVNINRDQLDLLDKYEFQIEALISKDNKDGEE